MATKRTSASRKAYYAAYKSMNKYATNRKRKLLKLKKEQPNNTQITAALNNIHYRRSTPKSPVWNSTKKATAALFKSVTGFMDSAVFNPNIELRNRALSQSKSKYTSQWTKVSFRMWDRARITQL